MVSNQPVKNKPVLLLGGLEGVVGERNVVAVANGVNSAQFEGDSMGGKRRGVG